MASVQVFGSSGNTAVDLSTNLKLSIAGAILAVKVEINPEESVLLKDKKLGFELVEPNAVVKYLTKDFAQSKAVEAEETQLYRALKSKAGKPAITQIGQSIVDGAAFDASKPSAAQIIVFASLYPALSGQSGESALSKWFGDFAQQPTVAKGIAHALSISKPLERATPARTGQQNYSRDFLVKSQAESILPKENERNILITSALPYVNNVPHLGNIIGSVLSADIYSRYVKNRNYNAVFVCGTDEYGTATETKALEEKVTPKELCDKYHKIHKEVYDWFDIGFDYFGRTTTEAQTEIAQDIFTKLYNNDNLEEKTVEQLYCETHKSFLADRFVEGICPKCQYEDARGDQCDKCGSLLDPYQLIKPRCKVDGATPVVRESTHIYIRLDKLEPEVKKWVEEASTKGDWTKNGKTITQSWLKQGLEPRCITRDLVWGTPVPLKGYENKVLYVWFDATIGYVSITANYFKNASKNSPATAQDWVKWWKNPENVDLYQFMGKDNVPFHTVVFPASQIGTGDNWTMLHHVSTTEYLQYEGGKFSKSRGVGVFGNNAKETGVSPSVWRYYLASIRPETSDSHFSWDEFVAKNNSELLANLGNFVNRLVKFTIAKYNGVIPQFDSKHIPNYAEFETDINTLLKSYINAMEAVNLRRGLEIAMAISSRGNQFLQDNKLDNSLFSNTPDKSDAVVGVGLNLIYLVSALIYPYMPETTKQISQILNAPALSITDKFELVLKGDHNIGEAQYLFKRIDEKKIEEWRGLYGGQK